MSQFVVGVTGGIGSGKTTVTDLFAEKGIVVVDADLIAREVVAPGSVGLKSIQAHFGDSVILPSGELDRANLRQRVFSHPPDKQWLDNLLHPLIREQMLLQSSSASSPYSILSIPLLVENNLMSMVNRVLVVDVEESVQLQRATNRDNHAVGGQQNTESTIKAIMQNQCTRQQRLAVADDVVNNSKDKSELIQQVNRLHQQYLSLASIR
ncbi:dephospho-CoA kinase [Glaciecola sp. SC05]|uniref:dephospho-CoA kinase n=1 Tax=Glaciecola sp. SC05 TaxID=1987355 RepID=UPI0035297000